MRKYNNVTIYPLAKIIYPENVTIGDESVIDDFVWLYASGDGIDIGRFCHIIVGTIMMAGGKITIADFSTIGPGCVVLAESDEYVKSGLVGLKILNKYRHVEESFVRIDKHVHIGARTTILPGVIIKEGCSIGAGSLVTKDMPAWTVCHGSPCKVIKDRIDAKQETLEIEEKFLEEYYKGNEK
jgi:acetyltransferase-like isoleucine patch superfamily enzyme